jgi:hypothetical protein
VTCIVDLQEKVRKQGKGGGDRWHYKKQKRSFLEFIMWQKVDIKSQEIIPDL